MDNSTSILKWFLFLIVDLAVLGVGGVLYTAYGHLWGLPVAFLGLCGVGFAAYEMAEIMQQQENAFARALKKLSRS